MNKNPRGKKKPLRKEKKEKKILFFIPVLLIGLLGGMLFSLIWFPGINECDSYKSSGKFYLDPAQVDLSQYMLNANSVNGTLYDWKDRGDLNHSKFVELNISGYSLLTFGFQLNQFTHNISSIKNVAFNFSMICNDSMIFKTSWRSQITGAWNDYAIHNQANASEWKDWGLQLVKENGTDPFLFNLTEPFICEANTMFQLRITFPSVSSGKDYIIGFDNVYATIEVDKINYDYLEQFKI